MKEARFFYTPNAKDNDRLPPEEAAHALRVLRLKADDEIFLTVALNTKEATAVAGNQGTQ